MSTTTTNYGFIKPELTDPADITDNNTNWDKLDNELNIINTKVIEANSTDGIAYVGTMPGVTELYNGLEVTIIPNMTSKSTQTTFNLNGLGALPIRMTLPFNSGNSGALPTITGFLGIGSPVTLRYSRKNNLNPTWYTDMQRPSASALYGSVPVQNGGTYINDNTTEEDIKEARKNLGVQAQITSGTAAPSGGSHGDVYIQIIS